MKGQSSVQGSASILIILIMISLTAFGMLSLMSAYSDFKLAKKDGEWAQAYYVLDTDAERAVGELNEELFAHFAKQTPGSSWDALLAAAPPVLEKLGWEVLSQEPVTAGMTLARGPSYLRVEIELREPGEDLRFFRVTCWQQQQDEFLYDEGWNVWEG